MSTEDTVVIVATLWAFFLLFFLLWCFSCCCFALCCPAKLSRCFACMAFVLAIVAVLVTALLTHRLDALANGTRQAAEFSFQGVKFIAGAVEHKYNSKPTFLRIPR